MPLEPGTNLGAYKILGLLGAGGMGEVYCALDPKLARRVAIKVLPVSLSGGEDALARFEREARALAALQHPGILAIHDFGREGEWSFAVTELLEGKTLRDKLGGGPLPLPRVLEIATELASALAAAHDRGIIHRDLKPANIFILKDGRMKLLDFGLAKQVSLPRIASAMKEQNTEPIPTGGDTEPGLLLGTVGYMAPEQVHGAPMDARTDIFAFGCLLFEMCTGRTLFKRESLVDTLHAILAEDPNLQDPLLPPILQNVVRRCLEKEPASRFQSAQDLAYTLEAIRGLPQYQPPPLVQIRRRWVMAGLLLLLVLTGGALGAVLWRRPIRPPAFRAMTFQRGDIYAARFTAGGTRVIYAARWGGDSPRLFAGMAGSAKSEPLGEEGASLLAVSKKGDLAMLQALRQHPALIEHAIGRLVQGSIAGQPLRTLAEGVSAADWEPTGERLAVVRRVDGRDRVEFPIGRLLEERPGWISDLRFDPEGRYLAFLDHPRRDEEGGTVVLLDVKSGQRRTLGENWGSARGLAWGPDGREVWFTAGRLGEPRALYALSLSGKLRFVYAAPRDLTLHDISPRGAVLLSQGEKSGGALGKPPEGIPRMLDLDRLSRVEALSEDGNWLLFSTFAESYAQGRPLFLQDLRTGSSKAFGVGSFPAVSPEGDRIVSAREAGGRWRFTVFLREDGSPKVLSSDEFTAVYGVCWHPDGHTLLICGTVGGESPRIWRMSLDTPGVQPISPEGIDPERPFRISPDGRCLIAAMGPVVYRFDLQDGAVLPQPLPAVDLTDRILGFEDPDHLLLAAGQALPVQVTDFALATGKRRPAFLIPALGHEGGLLDRAFQSAQGGKAYAGSYAEIQTYLFCVEGLK